MRRTEFLLLLALAAFCAGSRAEEATDGDSRLPYRGSVGPVREVEKPPQPVAPVPVQIPEETKPPVQTAIVEKIGAEGIEAFQAGNFEGAREAYLRVLKIEPNNLPALVNLGATEYRLGNSAEGERLLRR